MSLCRGIFLTALCTSVLLVASALARAQDATSATLQEPPKKPEATPTPRPERSTRKPSLEISTGTPNQKPAPAAEQTPGPEEMATPAAEAEKKTGVKRHATSGAKTTEARFSVPELMSISAAKAIAVSAPLPQYPFQAKRAHITGSGLCVMIVDTATGKVTNAMMVESTGDGILDKVTTNTLQRWRFKPGTVSQVRVPITYD
jgi:TonB family protein